MENIINKIKGLPKVSKVVLGLWSIVFVGGIVTCKPLYVLLSLAVMIANIYVDSSIENKKKLDK